MSNHSDMSDQQFSEAFAQCALPEGSFNHEAHLRLAWIHLRSSELHRATDTIRKQLTAFVKHVGAEDKYNETLTVAAVKMVWHFMQKSTSSDFKGFLREFPQLKTAFKELIEAHYSFDIFNSEEAKVEYLVPDLIPFPEA